MTLVNLTPHRVRVYAPDTPDRVVEGHLDDGVLFDIDIAPSTGPARLAMLNMTEAGRAYDDASGQSTWIDWQQFGQCTGLPAPVPGTIYIVSLLVARDQSHRADLIFPMAEVRNERGTVVGCRGFGRVC